MFFLESMLIAFIDKDLKGVALPHNDLVVIKAKVGESIVTRLLVDGGATVNVLYADC